MIELEVCANSAVSAIQAQEGGADRVELCANMHEGGTTPGPGTIQTARQYLQIELFVMIRPRGGDFCYNQTELQVMRHDIDAAKAMGADGVVLGILTPDGAIDRDHCAELIQRARPLPVTFHRAFDVCRDPFEALEALIGLGVERVLTAGQSNQAPEGAACLAQLVEQAQGRIAIMAGSGVNQRNVAGLAQETGVRAFHMSGRTILESAMRYRKPAITMGGCREARDYAVEATDAQRVRAMREALNAITL